MRMKVVRTLLWLALPGLGACGTDWEPDVLAHGKDSAELSILAKGRDTYATYCVSCHGEKGDGNGPGAKYLNPKPRDFNTCRVKFMSVPAGDLPRDTDLLTTITNGLHGTAMPSFRFVSREEREAVIEYLKTFCTEWARPGRAAPVPVGADIWAVAPKRGIAMGERVYHAYGRCWSCHPAYVERQKIADYLTSFDMPATEFRAELYESQIKDSDWGQKILPPDFLFHRIKTGLDVEALALVISAGVSGTAMPTWAGAMPPEQLWGIAHYLRDLALKRGTPAAVAMRKRLRDQPPYTPPAPEPEPESGPDSTGDNTQQGGTP